ncbi:hypothetical protein M8V02_23705, partial [Enterobacter hormaechei]|nr:hypothetical protein [Enterobacter hormaechei]
GCNPTSSKFIHTWLRFGEIMRGSLSAQRVLWDRDRLMGFMVGKGQGISGADHFWFGHTPVDKRYDFNNLHYIDTGAVFGGFLTLAQLQ